MKEYKTFGESTREDQLELVNHVLEGGEVEIHMKDMGTWHNTEMKKTGCICFYERFAYRKIKTELELLEEARAEIDKKIEELKGGEDVIRVNTLVVHKISHEVFKVEASGDKNWPLHIGGASYNQRVALQRFAPIKLTFK